MKISYKPVSVQKHAFIFCRYSVTILLWLAVFWRDWRLLALVGLILFFSALLKIRHAPMIVLYQWTLGKIFKSPQEILNESAMRFSHFVGAIFAAVSLLLVFLNPALGWSFAFGFAVFKTISAVGVCPASKLYECAGNGKCCAFAKPTDGKKTC